MIPILICIPFWKGDLKEAIALAKVIAGLQKHHVKNAANIMLIGRQDCQLDPSLLKILSEKFTTFFHKSMSPLKGWPSGSNGIFGDCMIHVCSNFSKKYECVFWCEPDCVPIKPNWFWDLVLEWRRRHPAAKIVGCRSDCNGDGTGDHITGCALYDPMISKILPEITRCDKMAWDYQCRAKIVSVGGHTNLIQNRYHQKNVDPGVINEPGVVLIHGVKDSSIINAVRNKYGIS